MYKRQVDGGPTVVPLSAIFRTELRKYSRCQCLAVALTTWPTAWTEKVIWSSTLLKNINTSDRSWSRSSRPNLPWWGTVQDLCSRDLTLKKCAINRLFRLYGAPHPAAWAGLYHTDQGYVYPERSSSWTGVGIGHTDHADHMSQVCTYSFRDIFLTVGVRFEPFSQQSVLQPFFGAAALQPLQLSNRWNFDDYPLQLQSLQHFNHCNFKHCNFNHCNSPTTATSSIATLQALQLQALQLQSLQHSNHCNFNRYNFKHCN